MWKQGIVKAGQSGSALTKLVHLLKVYTFTTECSNVATDITMWLWLVCCIALGDYIDLATYILSWTQWTNFLKRDL
jgi:hypothetical protein